MDVSAISSTSPMTDLFAEPMKAKAPSGDKAFLDMVNKYLSDVNAQQHQADKAVSDLVMGKTDNIHQVMLAMSKADLSFRTAIEVRNKAIDAYQEIMRTPL